MKSKILGISAIAAISAMGLPGQALAIDSQYDIVSKLFKNATGTIALNQLPLAGATNLTCVSVNRDRPMEFLQANGIGRVDVVIPGQGPLIPARTVSAPVGLWVTPTDIRSNPIAVSVSQTANAVRTNIGTKAIEFRRTAEGYLAFHGWDYYSYEDCEWNDDMTHEWCNTHVVRDVEAIGYCY